MHNYYTAYSGQIVQRTLEAKFLLLQARCETRALDLFKKIAGLKVAKFIWNALVKDACNNNPILDIYCVILFSLVQCYWYLVKLMHNFPSKSPLDRRWPKPSSFLFEEASEILRTMYHKWRVSKLNHLVV